MIMNISQSNMSTSLSCPSVSYTFNFNTYRTSKRILLLLAIMGSICCIYMVFHSSCSAVQTVFATLFGGLISIIVWLLTTFVTDKIQKELNEIDRLINVVDWHLSDINRPRFFEAPSTYNREMAAKDNVYVQYHVLVDCCIALKLDKDIDTSKLKIDWENRELSIDEFISIYEERFKSEALLFNEEVLNMSNWNLQNLDKELRGLRNTLLKTKATINKGPFDRNRLRHR